eukprot:CAMPEP_0118705558 /NCGR_PEP_ID=MMETSP0800-20121206/19931_1 /TAXON_ID=210618 ORGANISM="Striatella unipunctata, Strain CCMP2910" /NCGR_SAMPLE_ID=MMETSP0800 /ASSEMBLY_ACC=CAM_ASM_000638 /LENGTH=167 /DNA_ID=CAMNT_0006607719 /DNA_START=125 /DNA_END=625 /DNA_ORIENTATION=-
MIYSRQEGVSASATEDYYCEEVTVLRCGKKGKATSIELQAEFGKEYLMVVASMGGGDRYTVQTICPEPSDVPSAPPNALPTVSPSGIPTPSPSVYPSFAPTESPSSLPSASPSSFPTTTPTLPSLATNPIELGDVIVDFEKNAGDVQSILNLLPSVAGVDIVPSTAT